MFHLKVVISVQSFKRNNQVIAWIFQQCIALISWVHVLQMLWSIIYCSSSKGHFEMYYNTMQDWCIWGLRSAGETDKQPGCALWKLTKLEPNIQCTRLPMQSTGICTLVVWRGALPIAYWNMNNRQTWWMVRYLCQSSPKWQRPVMLSKELHCVCVVHS